MDFVGKVISLLFNMLSSFVITFLPRRKNLMTFSHWIIFPKGRRWKYRSGQEKGREREETEINSAEYHAYLISSVAQSCPTLQDPMNHCTPGLPVHHQLLDFTQTHVHWVGDAIQPSHPLSSPSPSTNLLHNLCLFKLVSCSHQVVKVLEFQLQHQSYQWTPRTDLL